MKLFLTQTAALNAENEIDHLCKVLEVFAEYIRAPSRKSVSIVVANKADQVAMNLSEVSISIKFCVSL